MDFILQASNVIQFIFQEDIHFCVETRLEEAEELFMEEMMVVWRGP